MRIYDKMLYDAIEKEKRKEDYIYSERDRDVLEELFDEIKVIASIDLHYLAELDFYKVPNAGSIMLKYIKRFESESIRSYLLPHVIAEKTENVDILVLDLYTMFRSSDSYISPPNVPAPSHICARYDMAFSKLKSKRIALDLLNIIKNPRDAYYLPLTIELLSKWSMPMMEDILLGFLYSEKLTWSDIGIEMDSISEYYPSLNTIQRHLRFTAIRNLKCFPKESNRHELQQLELISDKDTIQAIRKTLKVMEKAL